MARLNPDALNLEERIVRTNKVQKTHKGGRTMQDPDSCARFVTSVLRGAEPRAAVAATAAWTPPVELPLGQYTDDSQLARELMLSYAACGAFDARDYASRLGELFATTGSSGPGGPPRKSAGASPAAWRGSRRRSWPRRRAMPARCGRRRSGCFITTSRRRSSTRRATSRRSPTRIRAAPPGRWQLPGRWRLALRPGPIVVESFLAELSEWVRQIDQSVAFDVYQLSAWGSLSPEAAATFMVRARLCPGSSTEWRGVSSYVVTSVLWSLYCFLRTPEDYLETIYTAIAAGGDADTTAAMAGAISGAHLGLGALPAAWTPHLTDRGQWTRDELVAVTERCYAASTRRHSYGTSARRRTARRRCSRATGGCSRWPPPP